MTCEWGGDSNGKKGLSLALLLLLTVPAIAQQKMRDVISTMPDSLIPYLSENNRLDMIDFKEANMKAEVHNAFEGKTELMVLTDSYASITLNEAHRLQLRLLDVAAPASLHRSIAVSKSYASSILMAAIFTTVRCASSRCAGDSCPPTVMFRCLLRRSLPNFPTSSLRCYSTSSTISMHRQQKSRNVPRGCK